MILAVNPTFTTIAEAKRITGFSYIGDVSHSSKLAKTEKNKHELTYGIYLAPADASGKQVCPGSSEYCRAACLNMSGHNGLYTDNRIQKRRILKTQLLLAYPVFMTDWIAAEIRKHKAAADKKGYTFSVRINCTSDLNLTQFKTSAGKNLLETFPEIQFYDYTKVFNRINLTKVYSNYDLTYSFNGTNYDKCLAALRAGVRVAMVFEKKLPKLYDGIPVVNGDLYDARYLDPKNAIVGLVFKRVREKINLKATPFVISLEDAKRSDTMLTKINPVIFYGKSNPTDQKHLQVQTD